MKVGFKIQVTVMAALCAGVYSWVSDIDIEMAWLEIKGAWGFFV